MSWVTLIKEILIINKRFYDYLLFMNILNTLFLIMCIHCFWIFLSVTNFLYISWSGWSISLFGFNRSILYLCFFEWINYFIWIMNINNIVLSLGGLLSLKCKGMSNFSCERYRLNLIRKFTYNLIWISRWFLFLFNFIWWILNNCCILIVISLFFFSFL